MVDLKGFLHIEMNLLICDEHDFSCLDELLKNSPSSLSHSSGETDKIFERVEVFLGDNTYIW